MENDYLSLNNLKEIAEIDSHINTVRLLIDKYEWPSGVRAELEKRLSRIISKEKDESLNLSVIGEFTTGKSTFINAMVRHNLLVSSIMQGTTLANTIIDYCPKFAICLYHVNGKKAAKEFHDIRELKHCIAKITTNEKIAKVLKAVRIGLPSSTLSSGLRIIDTPGTNSVDKWHEEITKNALRNISDLSIVLVDATKPLPETLLDFIDTHLKGILHQCAFVVTKFDLIPKEERKMMMAYIKNRLSSFLNRDDIVVFPYVSPVVVNSFAPKTFDLEDEELLNLSLKSENDIIEYMGRQKLKAQMQKILFFLDELFNQIKQRVEKLKTEYSRELTMLENSRQIDLSSFVGNQKRKCINLFMSSVEEIKAETIDSFYTSTVKATDGIISNITSIGSIDGLSSYINDAIISDCECAARKIWDKQKKLLNRPKSFFSQSIQAFQADFENHFKDLSILKVTFSTKSKIPALQTIKTANLSVVKNYLSEQLSAENKAFGVGVIGATALGTAICPGIGTAIGLFAGLFAANKMAPDTGNVKKELIAKIRTPLACYFNSIAADLERTFNEYVKTLENQIRIEIDRYEAQYKNDVERKIKEQLKIKDEVQRKINALDFDCQLIDMRRLKLNDISNKITSLKNDL